MKALRCPKCGALSPLGNTKLSQFWGQTGTEPLVELLGGDLSFPCYKCGTKLKSTWMVTGENAVFRCDSCMREVPVAEEILVQLGELQRAVRQRLLNLSSWEMIGAWQ